MYSSREKKAKKQNPSYTSGTQTWVLSTSPAPLWYPLTILMLCGRESRASISFYVRNRTVCYFQVLRGHSPRGKREEGQFTANGGTSISNSNHFTIYPPLPIPSHLSIDNNTGIHTGLAETKAATLGKAGNAWLNMGTWGNQQEKGLGIHFTPWEVHCQREEGGQPIHSP